MDAGPENSSQLSAKNVALLQTKPNRSPAQEGVHLLGHLEVREKFISAQIQSANDHRAGIESGSDLAVGIELLLLGRKRFPVNEQILGPVKAHPFSATGQNCLGVGRLLDIGRKNNTLAIQGDGRFV